MSVSTGEECPCGTAVFQRTFFAGPNSAGRPVADEIPVPFGPLNRDQSSGAADRTTAVAERMQAAPIATTV